jgi:hypothetical protein
MTIRREGRGDRRAAPVEPRKTRKDSNWTELPQRPAPDPFVFLVSFRGSRSLRLRRTRTSKDHPFRVFLRFPRFHSRCARGGQGAPGVVLPLRRRLPLAPGPTQARRSASMGVRGLGSRV